MPVKIFVTLPLRKSETVASRQLEESILPVPSASDPKSAGEAKGIFERNRFLLALQNNQYI